MPDLNSIDYPNAYRYRRIVQAKRYIDDHFTEPVNLEEISNEACFSKFHFLRVFKQAYGKTPNQYLIELRIELARKLLEDKRISITGVCYEVGFESVGSFSSLFKNTTGFSPTAYRSRKLEKKKMISENPILAVPGCFADANGWI